MTADTKAHFKIDRYKAIHAFNISVAIRAIKFMPAHVREMTKKNVIRRKKYPDPGNGFFPVKVLPFLYDLRMLGDDVLMAEKTFFYGWQPCVL